MSKSKSGYRRVKWLFGKEIEVPDEWIKTNLNAVCRSVRDGTHTPPRRTSSGIPLLSAQNIMNNGINWKEHFSYISKYDFEQITKNNKISINDILITIVGTIGRVCVAQNNNEFTVQRSVAILKLRDSIVPQFLNYYMQSLWFIQIIQQKSSGVAQKGVYLNDLKQIKIFYPDSKIEQKKIASILSGVDALIESTQKVIEKTERLKKGLMQKLLTKGIGHTKFKKTKWLFGKEIEIPQEWNVTRLIEQCIQKPKYGAGESAIEKDLKLPRYIRITDLNDDGSLRNKEWKSIKENAAKDYLLNYNDILFARTGATVGKSYLYTGEDGRCAFAGYLIKFQPDQTKLNSKFLFHYIHSIYYWKYIKSIQTWGVQPNINAEQYSNLLILLPPIHEQQKIASILSGVDAYIQKNQEYKKKMELLKKGLMQKLLTGQIRVKVDH